MLSLPEMQERSPLVFDVGFEGNIARAVSAYLSIHILFFQLLKFVVKQHTQQVAAMLCEHFPEHPIESCPRPVWWFRLISSMKVVDNADGVFFPKDGFSKPEDDLAVHTTEVTIH